MSIKPGDYVTANTYRGVAFYVQRNDVELVYDDDWNHDEPWSNDEPEEVTVPDRFVCTMVGDDREHIIDVEDLEPLDEDHFCPGCGQTGCGHYQ